MKTLLLVFLSAVPALPWNFVGHMAVAGLAYDQLTPEARRKVDQLLLKHPDYAMFVKETPPDQAGRARWAFMRAAIWADSIKGDARFYNEAFAGSKPTPLLPGFPDMRQHRDWHYIDVPFSTDGTPTKPPPVPNALTELQWMIPALGKSAPVGTREDPVYILPWVLHLAGDLHQPLHTTARFRKGQNDTDGKPTDDQGGNLVYIEGSGNLHTVWDGALGSTLTNEYLNGLIASLAKLPKEAQAVRDPARWVAEGLGIAKADVYSFGNAGGYTEKDAIKLSGAYMLRTRNVARERAALAGQRLAALLNELLGK